MNCRRVDSPSNSPVTAGTSVMMLQFGDTIAALSSASGPAERGIIRLSGNQIRDALEPLFVPDTAPHRTLKQVAFRNSGRLRCEKFSTEIPVALYCWPTPRSYTGEPMAEIHTVGSPPILEAILTELFAQGVRPARPGEFTLRAFLNGRVDLVQAEAVLGVIDARNEEELECALRQLAGGVSGKLSEIREGLVNLLAELEAGLDFVEEDIEFVSRSELSKRLGEAQRSIKTLMSQASTRMQSTGRSRVILAGLPNAGKSSLFNALLGREEVLVSDEHGTTRDYISAQLDWEGAPIELVDTAGWENRTDELRDRIGSLRERELNHADLVIWCTARDLDSSWTEEDSRGLQAISANARSVIHIATKCDLDGNTTNYASVRVSARDHVGLRDLQSAAVNVLANPKTGQNQLTGTTAARCFESLSGAETALMRGLLLSEGHAGEEIIVIEVRTALDHLGEILGVVYTDDILDRIFSKFCIGK